jgi:hypothetical protein
MTDDVLELQPVTEWYGPTNDEDRPVLSPFVGDDEVIRYCTYQASHGSRLHLLAIILERRPVDSQLWVPDFYKGLDVVHYLAAHDYVPDA